MSKVLNEYEVNMFWLLFFLKNNLNSAFYAYKVFEHYYFEIIFKSNKETDVHKQT